MNSSEFPLVKNEIKIAMLGLVDGNGHPYSWSAIFNGYDASLMKDCPYPAIPAYLSKQPKSAFGIDQAKVTHIWTENKEESEKIAKATFIPNVVSDPRDVIDEVDAVIIPTDKGFEHVERCRPFIEAGIPIFIDKPLVDNEKDLSTFKQWEENGARIMSSSSMRYSKEFIPYHISTNELGKLRYVSVTTAKSWERYGIHALEAMYPIVGPGFISVTNTGDKNRNVVHITHENGIDISIIAIDDMYGGFGFLQLCGTDDGVQLRSKDTFYAFKKQLESFIEYLRTGERPFAFSETCELMKMIIAGIKSRELNGETIYLKDIKV